jgi:hypothetical protein
MLAILSWPGTLFALPALAEVCLFDLPFLMAK